MPPPDFERLGNMLLQESVVVAGIGEGGGGPPVRDRLLHLRAARAAAGEGGGDEDGDTAARECVTSLFLASMTLQEHYTAAACTLPPHKRVEKGLVPGACSSIVHKLYVSETVNRREAKDLIIRQGHEELCFAESAVLNAVSFDLRPIRYTAANFLAELTALSGTSPRVRHLASLILTALAVAEPACVAHGSVGALASLRVAAESLGAPDGGVCAAVAACFPRETWPLVDACCAAIASMLQERMDLQMGGREE